MQAMARVPGAQDRADKAPLKTAHAAAQQKQPHAHGRQHGGAKARRSAARQPVAQCKCTAPASRQSGGAVHSARLAAKQEARRADNASIKKAKAKARREADEVKKEQHKRLDSQLENTQKKPGFFYAQRGVSTDEEARRAEKAAIKKAKAKARKARRAHKAKVEAKRAVDTLRQEQRQRKFHTHF
jgi:hypothetical protein